jgi:hypothetical protein
VDSAKSHGYDSLLYLPGLWSHLTISPSPLHGPNPYLWAGTGLCSVTKTQSLPVSTHPWIKSVQWETCVCKVLLCNQCHQWHWSLINYRHCNIPRKQDQRSTAPTLVSVIPSVNQSIS